MMKNRVVVTGIGAVTSIGLNVKDFWENLLIGKSGISQIELWDAETYPYDTKRGGEIKNFNVDNFEESDELRVHGRATQYALIASREAMLDSGIQGQFDSDRMGVAIGTTNGEPLELHAMDVIWEKKGFVNEFTEDHMERFLPFKISQELAKKYRLYGPNNFTPNACSAGNFAIGNGFDLIRRGEVDAMLVGGSDAFNIRTFSGFARVGGISTDVPRPFSKDRQGMMPGEGAGMLVIESLDHAKARGAKIYAELINYGFSCDAYHITQPDVDGVSRAYIKTLEQSNIKPDEVDFISAHGTGTNANDQTEATAMIKVFGESLKKISIDSIKSMIGHTMGAASALEAIVSVLSIQENKIPPTMNHIELDPKFQEIDGFVGMDVVPNSYKEKEVKVVFETASGFGGNNCALVFREIAE